MDILNKLCELMDKYHGLHKHNTGMDYPCIYAPRHFFADGSKPDYYDVALDEFYAILSFVDKTCNIVLNDWELKKYSIPNSEKMVELYISDDSCLPYSISILPC